MTASIRVFIISYLRAAFVHSTIQRFEDGDGTTASVYFRRAMDDAVPSDD